MMIIAQFSIFTKDPNVGKIYVLEKLYFNKVF